jgi:hypothetical protein
MLPASTGDGRGARRESGPRQFESAAASVLITVPRRGALPFRRIDADIRALHLLVGSLATSLVERTPVPLVATFAARLPSQ